MERDNSAYIELVYQASPLCLITSHLNIHETKAIRRLPSDPAELRKDAIFCHIVFTSDLCAKYE